MLELKKIYKSYQMQNTFVQALTDVNLKFGNCGLVSILGPSGCGKTTLLNIIGGLDKYTSGDLIVDNVSTVDFTESDWNTYRNRKIGFVFQNYNLITHQTALENVELAMTVLGENKVVKKRKALKALESVGLENHLRKKPNALSGGEMQRVAIARAIVNNPEVILADEPTGALDSKTSVQIMDLLKDISKQRLVIMVTHNEELANKYSDRIIRFLDSKVISDTKPFVEKKVDNGNKKTAENTNCNCEKRKNKNKFEGKESKMGLKTALSLSFKNLLTKKTRTILASIASSIGIVGLALVLSLYNGLNTFLDKIQYDTLSSYPMSISTSWDSTDTDAYLSIILDESNYKTSGGNNKIFVNHLITKLNEVQSIKNKITPKLIDYVNKIPQNYDCLVGYDYGISLNLFKKKSFIDLVSYEIPGGPSKILFNNAKVDYGKYFKEIVGDEQFVLRQYDLVAGKFPTEKNELCLVLDGNSAITDTMLVAFLIDLNATNRDKDGNFIINEYNYSDFLPDKNGVGSDYGTFTVATNDGLYKKNDNNKYEKNTKNLKNYVIDMLKVSDGAYSESLADSMTNALSKSGLPISEFYNGDLSKTLDLTITGIIKLKDGVTSGVMGAYPIGYTSKLTEYMLENSLTSQIVTEQLAELEKALKGQECRDILKNKVITDNGVDAKVKSINKLLKNLSYVELPTTINFYAKSFDQKQEVKKYVSNYNKTINDDEKVYISDVVSTVMNVLEKFIDTILYILLSLMAISLFVAAIMMVIITYVSVLERTKEIGILRSIGARKFDIASVFNAETIIIGLLSGVIGIIFAVILQIPLNSLLLKYTTVSNLAVLLPSHALILVAVSITVTLLSGMIPAIMASKKDPVKALKSE